MDYGPAMILTLCIYKQKKTTIPIQLFYVDIEYIFALCTPVCT